jgi:hypothetical protein
MNYLHGVISKLACKQRREDPSSDLSDCASDCSSCFFKAKDAHNQQLLLELHGVKSGNNSEVDLIVCQMLDRSCLTPSKLALIKRKRVADLEDEFIVIDKELRDEITLKTQMLLPTP